MSTRCRARAAAVASLVTLLAVTACKSPTPFVADVDATRIVAQNSSDAFVTFFDASADGAAFRRFDALVVVAQDRAGLTAAWRTEPSLVAQGADFLAERVFAPAMAEHRWPRTTPAGSLERSFVEGVHLGVQEFLNPVR